MEGVAPRHYGRPWHFYLGLRSVAIFIVRHAKIIVWGLRWGIKYFAFKML